LANTFIFVGSRHDESNGSRLRSVFQMRQFFSGFRAEGRVARFQIGSGLRNIHDR
jgi:hypothetical protein